MKIQTVRRQWPELGFKSEVCYQLQCHRGIAQQQPDIPTCLPGQGQAGEALLRRNSGDLVVAAASVWGGIFAICRIPLVRSPVVSCTPAKWAQTLPQAIMVGIERAQTRRVDWSR